VSDGDFNGANADGHDEINADSNVNLKRVYADNYESTESNAVKKARGKKCTKEMCGKATKEGSKASSLSDKEAMKTWKKVLKQNRSKQMKAVLLLSMNSKDQVVAVGNLISRNMTHVVGGSILGDEYYCVVVHSLTDAAEDEILPRPYDHIRTLEDAVGCCIAWPRKHVKRVKHKKP
uniref:Transposase Tnp1/En/Spm-like domain-containing protein n=1 Tax=Oryza brachyantha TaxID=4533 RepID=J3KU76_ORYBR